MPEPLRRHSLTDKVYQHLTAKIATGELPLGERVNARQIALELNVSRTTANKAIEQLVADGLVAIGTARHPIVAALPVKFKVHSEAPFEFLNQTDSTYERLLDRLLRGGLGPGEIVKERPLAAEMGVNPATVRRAAEWLSADGLLERLPRRGWRVALLTPRDLKDVYGIRLLLEPAAVVGAVQRISDEELDNLEQQTQRMIDLGERATVYDRREADHSFHMTICTASGNKVLANTLEPLIHKALIVTTVGFRYGRSARSFEEHRQLLAALRARDEREAAKQIKLHLRNAVKFNAELWERQPS